MTHARPVPTSILAATALLPLVLGAPLASVAHDLWLLPPEKVAAKAEVTVLASVGMDFPTSTHAADAAAFLRRTVVRPDGSTTTMEPAGTDEVTKTAAMKFTPDRAGWWIVGVETAPKLITLPAAEFNDYLLGEGLAHVFQLRAKEKSLGEPGRERYSKSPKALVRVGAGGPGDPTRAIGLPLEIVPLSDPAKLAARSTLPLRVLFRGGPLADAWLGWDLPADGEAVAGTARTNASGEALVPVLKPGLMTVRLTHMTRPKTADYEWESFWTTLTFRVGK